MRVRLAWLLPLGLAIGCASTQPMRRVALDETCATSIEQLTVHPAFVPDPAQPKLKPKQAQFADYAACVERDGVRTGGALFRIDKVPAPSTVTLTIGSDPRGTLAAKVELLGEDFKVVRSHGFDEFVRRGMQYTLDMFHNAGDPPVRYLLVSPDAAQMGGVDQHLGSQTSTLFVGTGYYMHGTESTSNRPLGDAGILVVSVRPQGSTPLKN